MVRVHKVGKLVLAVNTISRAQRLYVTNDEAQHCPFIAGIA
jgi:hypothetical protein